MKTQWFKKVGWVYIPFHAMGFLTTILAVLFLIPVFISVDRNAHSVSDELYQLFVFVTCTAFWWKWIAEKTS
jgi:uncharacterized membrane protein